MESWGNVILINAASATVLAGIVAVIAVRSRRPSLVHALWVLVLLKLVSVPAFEIPFLPTIDRVLPSEPTVASAVAIPETFRPAPASRGLDPRAALAIVVALGAASLLSLAAWRTWRFTRLLRRASEAPPALRQRVARLAGWLGLTNPPAVRIVPERIPPAVWPAAGRCQILLPERLLERLSTDELDTLLAHELAHVRRRDHWIRPIELLITALYWWLPVTWWARRNLRAAEEESCDELVLASLPGRSRVYAESLLKTVEFLSARAKDPVPALAIGAGGKHRLKERVVMILNRDVATPITSRARAALVALALVAMLVSPTWVESKAVREHEYTQQEKEHIVKMLAVHRAELRLEKELHELHMKRAALDHRLQEIMMETEKKELSEEAQRLLEAGEALEAEELKRHLELVERRAAREFERSRADQVVARKQAELEFQLRELELSREELETGGQLELAQEVIEKAIAVEQLLDKLRLEVLETEVQHSQERLEEAARLAEEAERVRREQAAD